MAQAGTDSGASSDDDSSGALSEDATWISWFTSIRGNEFFCEVDDEYVNDDFNLTGLSAEVPYYDYALDTILDVESANAELLTEEQQETVDAAAELLYGLIHARYIITTKGLAAMFDKYKEAEFGRCNRVLCEGCPMLPVGTSDLPRRATVCLYCPRCSDIYYPRSVRHQNIDGAYMGTTFAHLFLMTYPQFRPSPSLAYEPKVFGFRIHALAPSVHGPSNDAIAAAAASASGGGGGGGGGNGGAVVPGAVGRGGGSPGSGRLLTPPSGARGRTSWSFDVGGGASAPARELTAVLGRDSSGRLISRKGAVLTIDNDHEFFDEEELVEAAARAAASATKRGGKGGGAAAAAAAAAASAAALAAANAALCGRGLPRGGGGGTTPLGASGDSSGSKWDVGGGESAGSPGGGGQLGDEEMLDEEDEEEEEEEEEEEVLGDDAEPEDYGAAALAVEASRIQL